MRKLLPAVLAAVLASCGGSSDEAATRSRPAPVLGSPISGVAAGQWGFIPFPDSTCGDGSATGIGVSGGTADLLVYLEGGGACWSYDNCFASPLVSTLGPFGAAQLAARMAVVAGSLFDRSDPTNPFKDWTFVYVPYCTGDVHGGDRVTSYAGPGGSGTVHHRGHANVVAYLKRLAATWPDPSRVVVSGSSAGGFGTLTNYDTFRLYWPTQRMYLVDDAGSVVPGIPDFERDAWYANWNFGASMDEFCPDCRTDLTRGYAALSRWYPNDRKALLSYTQDSTIRMFFAMSAQQFEQNLRSVASGTLGPSGWRWFYASGSTHTLLRDLDAHASQGVTLKAFLSRQVGDDPAWASVTPP